MAAQGKVKGGFEVVGKAESVGFGVEFFHADQSAVVGVLLQIF